MTFNVINASDLSVIKSFADMNKAIAYSVKRPGTYVEPAL